jgi:Putative adhesin
MEPITPQQPYPDPMPNTAPIPPAQPMLPILPQQQIPPPKPRQRISMSTRVIGIIVALSTLVLIACIITGGFAGSIVFFALRQPPVTESGDKAFTIQQKASLVVHNSFGRIRVVSGESMQVSLSYVKTAYGLSAANARDNLKTFRINSAQTGDHITIGVQYDTTIGFTSLLRHTDITVTVPSTTDVDVHNSAGDIEITGVTGQIVQHNSAGNTVFTNDTFTGNSSLDSSAGKITIINGHFESSIPIKSSAGSIHMDGKLADGASLNISNSAGDISFDAELSTNNTLHMTDSAGSITLALPINTKSHVSAHTNAGSIAVEGFPLTINHSGSTSSLDGVLGGASSNDINLQCSAGQISLQAQ